MTANIEPRFRVKKGIEIAGVEGTITAGVVRLKKQEVGEDGQLYNIYTVVLPEEMDGTELKPVLSSKAEEYVERLPFGRSGCQI